MCVLWTIWRERNRRISYGVEYPNHIIKQLLLRSFYETMSVWLQGSITSLCYSDFIDLLNLTLKFFRSGSSAHFVHLTSLLFWKKLFLLLKKNFRWLISINMSPSYSLMWGLSEWSYWSTFIYDYPFLSPCPCYAHVYACVCVLINSILVHIVLAETCWCSSLFSVKALS